MQQITAGDRNEQANTKMKRWCGWQRETDTSYGKWPLLSCLDIWIMVGSAAQDTAPRFVDSFQATWSRLPANVQSGLTHTWKSSEDGFPKFFLFDELVDHDSEHGTCGIYSGLAHQPRFDFSGAFVRDMPDCLVETLI